MPIDTSMYAISRNVPQVDPTETLGRVLSLKSMMQQQALNQARAQEYALDVKQKQQDQAAQQKAAELLSANTKVGPDGIPVIDYGAVYSGLNQAGHANYAAKLKSQQIADLKADYERKEAYHKMEGQKAARLGSIANSITDQGSYEQGVRLALNEGLITPDIVKQLPPVYDPATVKQFQMRAVGVQQAHEMGIADAKAKHDAAMAPFQERKARADATESEAKADESTRSNVASTLALAKTKDDYAQQWYAVRAKDPKLASTFPHPDTFDPKATPDAVRMAGMNAKEQASAATAAKNAENNVSIPELELRAVRGDKDAQAALDAQMTRQIKIAQASKNTGEIEGIIDRTARAIAGGNLSSIKSISSLRSGERLMLFDKIRQYNPNFSEADLKRQIDMEDYMANGKGADQLQSFGTFLQHSGEASDVVNNIRLGQSRYINKPMNWWRSNMSGSPEYSALVTALEPVKKEFQSFLLGGKALYEDDRKAMNIILDENSSPAQIQSALKQMGKTAKDRLVELNGRYKRVRHQDFDQLVGPEAMEGARKIGVDLNFGGGGSSTPRTTGIKEDLSKLSTEELMRRVTGNGR